MELTEVLEIAKKDRKELCKFKNAAMVLHQYEFAAKLREIELATWPETEEHKAARILSSNLSLALRMVELNVDKPVCWLIYETIKQFNEKGAEFSIDDAAKLTAKKEELFFIADK